MLREMFNNHQFIALIGSDGAETTDDMSLKYSNRKSFSVALRAKRWRRIYFKIIIRR